MSDEFEKESQDPMIRSLVSVLMRDLSEKEVVFSIQGENLTNEEVCAHNGLLPLFCYKAAVWSEEVLKKPLPLFFEPQSKALMDVVPMTEGGANNIFALWAHFLHFSVEEEMRRLIREKKMKNGIFPLDELFVEWTEAMSANRFIIRPSARSPAERRGTGT